MTPASASAAARTVGAAAPVAQSVQLVGGVGRSADPDLYARLRCTLRGTTHDDELLVTDERDVICARGGDDVIEGALGNDVVYAGPGSDRLFGRPGNDLLIGGAGSDVLNGGVGVDLCSDVIASAMVRCET
jgi:Ca2+-binding RTX toxin-like protein